MKNIIIIPGLGDYSERIRQLVHGWESARIHLTMFLVDWSKGNYTEEMKRLLRVIDELATANNPIGIIGISAGGSLAINALAEVPDRVRQVVNICGRVTRSGYSVMRPLALYSRTHPVFIESVQHCEENIDAIDKGKLLTISGYFDEVVSASSVAVSGATNMRVPSIMHAVNIYLALTYPFTRDKIIQFVSSE